MSGGAVSQRSANIGAAGFLPPRLPPVVIDRPRLTGMFGIESHAAWTIVVGGPGSGKTTLVRAWVAARDEPAAWITLTSTQYRQFGLAEKLVRAVQAALPTEPLDTVDDIGAPIGDADLLDRLLDELSVIRVEPVVLVIDDTHLLNGSEWTLMERLIAQLPPTLHLVAVGRSEPPLPLGRERATGRLATIRSEDLAFDASEAASLLELVAGPSPDDTARAVHAATEGWAIGIRLAALAIRDGASAASLLDGLGHRSSTVAEFLVEEVLDHLPPDRRVVLGKLSLLRLLEPELCDAVTGRSDCGAILHDLALDGLFVVRVDAERYRYHPLLADLLRFELERDDPDSVRAVHLAAAAWLEDHDRPIDAIEHLVGAGKHASAHALVLDFFRPLYVGTRRHDVDRWLTAVPDEVITETPERALDHCVALALVGHDEVGRWYRYCLEHVPADDDWLTSRLDAIAALDHIVNGRLDQARASWRRSRDRRPAGHREPIDEVLQSWDIRLEAMFGQPSEAVASARRFQRSERKYVGDAPVLSVLAGALAASGDLEEAGATAARAIDMWRELGEPALPGLVDAFVVAAGRARQQGDLDAADELLDHAMSIVPHWAPGPNAFTMIPLVERARVAHDRGDASWRTQLLGLAEVMRTRSRPPDVIEWVEQARQELDLAAEPSHTVTLAAAEVAMAETLTDRETTVLELLASHLSLPEIGTELFISPHTVKSHVKSIYRKLGVSSRSEAVRTARELGLLA